MLVKRACRAFQISCQDTQLYVILLVAFFFQKSKVAKDPILAAPNCMHMPLCIHIGTPLKVFQFILKYLCEIVRNCIVYFTFQECKPRKI